MISTPLPPFGTAIPPLESVPIRFESIVATPAPLTRTPACLFPEMTFRWIEWLPWMTTTPSSFGIAVFRPTPIGRTSLMPTKFATTMVETVPLRLTPAPSLPEITLALGYPIKMLPRPDAFIVTPSPPFGTARAPAASAPMELLLISTAWSEPSVPSTSTPLLALPPIRCPPPPAIRTPYCCRLASEVPRLRVPAASVPM